MPFEHADIFGDGIPGSTALRREEYANTHIRLPAHHDALAAFVAGHVVRVSGPSGTGKTTLAATLAHDVDVADSAFYVDLAGLHAPLSLADRALLTEQMSEWDAPRRLFILDNAHVDPKTERAVIQNWLAVCGAGRLIILTRQVGGGSDTRIAPVFLEVNAESVLAVWRRERALAGRIWPTPSRDTIEAWQHAFGDLVSLTLAFQGSVGRLDVGVTRLSERDAVDYVHEKYLAGRSRESRETFLLLAVAGQHEFGLSVASLNSSGLEPLVAEGLVHQHRRHCTLGHPATARLLLRALGPVDETSVLSQIAISEPYVISGIAARMVQVGQRSDGKRLVTLLIAHGRMREGLIEQFNLPNLMRLVRQLVDLGAVEAAEVDRQLAGSVDVLMTRAEGAPPVEVAHFLEILRQFPITFGLFRVLLNRSETREQFLDWALDAPIATLLNVGLRLRRLNARLSGELLDVWSGARCNETLESVPNFDAGLLSTVLREHPNKDFSTMVATRLEATLDEVVRRTLSRSAQETVAYHAALERRLPMLAPLFRERLAHSELTTEVQTALAVTDVWSLPLLLSWAIDTMPRSFASSVADSVAVRLETISTPAALATMNAERLDRLMKVAPSFPAVETAVAQLDVLFAAHRVEIGRTALARGLATFVALVTVLERHFGADLGSRFRALIHGELSDLAASELARSNARLRRTVLAWPELQG